MYDKDGRCWGRTGAAALSSRGLITDALPDSLLLLLLVLVLAA
jgi:hypothetical protein